MSDAARPWVLGISASHNGAVCLLHGDEIAVAIQEERLLRSKRARIHGAHGSLALEYVLRSAGIRPRDLASVTICAQDARHSTANDIELNPALQLTALGIPHHSISHHTGHAHAAFATSGFAEAAALIVDGHGSPVQDLSAEELRAIGPIAERIGNETISVYHCEGVTVTPVEKHGRRWDWVRTDAPKGAMPRFGSLGGMYASVGLQIFGHPLDGAGKVMGLAPYGTPDVPVSDFFEIVDGRFVFSEALAARYRHRERWPDRRQEYMNLAASVQRALEEALLYLARRAREQTGSENLVFAGGVALNSVANERILREAGFKHVFFQPAAEDSGIAIGAAYAGLWRMTKLNTRRRLLHDAVGRDYSAAEIDQAIEETPFVVGRRSPDIVADTVTQLTAGKIVGWFQGRSELGPRSLGQRSILCDPRGEHTKDILNHRVKHREGFRPFAPVVLLEEANAWFELDGVTPESPSMLRVARFREEKRALVPAVVHVDGTGRIQTVTAEANGPLYEVVRAFYQATGVPIILNTSLNVAGEPIVESPADALWCLLYTGLDSLVLADRFVEKQAVYRSALQLVPRLRADRISTVVNARTGRVRPSDGERGGGLPLEGIATAALHCMEQDVEAMSEEYAHFRVPTAWGSASYLGEVALLQVLDQLDGTRTGQEILARLQDDGHALDDTQMIRILGTLRRASIISMHGPNGDRPSAPPKGSGRKGGRSGTGRKRAASKH